MDPQQGPPQQPDLLIGQTVGSYLVTQKLGEGGMGAVYLAEHPTIGKKVALKVLHQEFSQNPDVAERFLNEAKSVNAIGHPNIVDISDYGVIRAGAMGKELLVYFIMEYLSGATLSHLIRTESPLAPERALMIALQVADALAASHKAGIVHRDLKPDNIMLVSRHRERDFVKLLDFGIAKLTGDAASSHRTRTGLVLGTPAYMSPEQCEGRANVDHRTDIYALGIVLYEMLVGRVPFIGEGYGEILVQHLTQRPIEPSRYRMMSPHVEAVVMKALEKTPQMRYPTMDEFMRAMSDPVGYVEAHGGVTSFLQTQLMPSSAPLPPIRPTPAPMTGMTPVPYMHSPVPGTLSPVPTTLGAAAGQAVPHSRSRAGLLVAGAVVVAAATVGIILVVNRGGGGGENREASPGSNSSALATGSGSSAGSSTETLPPKTGSGSNAIAQNTGSGSNAGSGSGATNTVKPPEWTTSAVTVTSEPKGAEILVNGYAQGKTPREIMMPRGTEHQEVVLRLKGYEDKTLDVIPDEPKKKIDGGALVKVHHTTPNNTNNTNNTNNAHPPNNGRGSNSQTHPPNNNTTQNPGNDTDIMRP